ncbi:hypothetical protein BGZ89_004015 [Linnemannia elongata]|nr:hypothetical protein BGZ89_004015 [Linnemannia elongata]
MTPAIFGLRLVMVFVALVNFSITIAFYAYLIPLINKVPDGFDSGQEAYEFYWGDYTIIIASVVLLIAYLYSIWGKKAHISNKYARAVLMLLPALFLIGVQLRQVDLTIKFAKMVNESRPSSALQIEPFSCANSDGSVDAKCSLVMSHIFVPVVTGFLTIIEVAVTLFRGPLHPAAADNIEIK